MKHIPTAHHKCALVRTTWPKDMLQPSCHLSLLYSEQISQGAGEMANKCKLGHLGEEKTPIRPLTTD